MNERQFMEFELNERMDIINLKGKYVGFREYYNQRLNLYALYDFHAEVFYDPLSNEITDIQVANPKTIEKLYPAIKD